MAQSPQPRNAAQLAAVKSHYESQLREILSQLNLRKWLVERMIEKLSVKGDFSIDEFIKGAERLHDFIVLPALKGIDPPKSDVTG